MKFLNNFMQGLNTFVLAVGSRYEQEPAAVNAVVGGLISLFVTFGLPLSPEQKGAIDAFLVILAGAVTRQQVVPKASLT